MHVYPGCRTGLVSRHRILSSEPYHVLTCEAADCDWGMVSTDYSTLWVISDRQ